MKSSFYNEKTVFITGHTGFKGSWMCHVLQHLGAHVVGYSLEPPTTPNLYDLTKTDAFVKTIKGDIRDYYKLEDAISKNNPDIVIHMAAQPLVGIGYSDPRLTYETNVMGTVNILESIRKSDSVKSFVNVTTDKVYLNNEWEWGYRENDILNGFDPYSNSKSCSELVTSCYNNSFLKTKIPISTARAGNVIGGGDFTNPRIIPDCVRSVLNKKTMILRNPGSTRPYQHVLEPICAYLLIAEKQVENKSYSDSYNVGPDDNSCVNNKKLVELFGRYWGEDFSYDINIDTNEPHEANYLKLDCSKISTALGWKPLWNIDEAVSRTVSWTKSYCNSNHIDEMNKEICDYLSMSGLWEYE